MATMYSLFLGFLFTALCSVNGCRNSVLDVFKSSVENGFYSLYQGRDFHFFLDEKTKQKNQGLVAKLPAQAAGGSYFFSAKKYAKNSSLKTFDTEEVHPRAIVKNFLGDKGSECKGLAYYTTSLQLGLISPLKQFPIKDDLLTYGVKGRKAIIYKNLHFAAHKDFQSKGRKKGVGTLETALIALRSRDEHRLNSLDLCGTFYQGKVPRWSADEDNKRIGILNIATAELGVKESTGNNDGLRVDNSLRLAQPKPFYSASATRIPLQSGLMSPVKLLTIAEGSTTVQSKGSSDKGYGYNNLMLDGIHELTGFGWTLGRYQVSRPSGMEDKRSLIVVIASKELGTREATDNNDGPRIEEYLRYTNLGPHHEWCAAFISWCYGQAGFDVPRNPWSPALFPKARRISKDQCRSADVFGIYGSAVKRINHVGLVKEKQGQYIVTIEGNSNNRVESRRRHLRTVYAIADWVNE